MLLEPAGLAVKHTADGTPGVLTWVDDVDKTAPTDYWALGHDATAGHDRLQVTNLTGDTATTPLEVRPDDTTVVSSLSVNNDVDVSGTIRENGVPVVTDDDVGIDVENDDGVPLVQNTDAMRAGTDLSFTDDGDETVTLSFTGTVSPPSAALGKSATASGDGTTTSFTVQHGFSGTPDAVSVEATSSAAAGDFHVTNVGSSTLDIVYASAPPSGTDNLSWTITSTGSGLSPVTVSDNDSTVLPNPDDLNFETGLSASDDGDGTVSMGIDGTVPQRGVAETVNATWTFAGSPAVGVASDSDIGFTSSGTTQFGIRYDSTNDRLTLADRANSTPILHADRSGTVDFQATPTVNGETLPTVSADVTTFTSGSATAGQVATADGAGNVTWTTRTRATTATVSGDGSATTFSLPNPLDTAPTAVDVTPTSPAAMSDFYVSAKTASSIDVTYATPPPSGTDNLSFDVLAHA